MVKTWLAELLAVALGGAAHPLQNNFTEAGIRQALTGEARALILDEAERDEGGRRIKAVIETIRHMSVAAGARVVRGTAGGIAQGFTLAGPIYLSAVLAGALKPQDRSRMRSVTSKASRLVSRPCASLVCVAARLCFRAANSRSTIRLRPHRRMKCDAGVTRGVTL